MSKRFLFLTGALAIMLAFALNLRHASSSYGLRDSTFLPFVEVLGTETGSPGTVYCLGVSCMTFSDCSLQYDCSCVPDLFKVAESFFVPGYGWFHCDESDYWVIIECAYYVCLSYQVCAFIKFGTKFSQMSSEMPTHTNWVYGGQNGTCSQWCGT